MGASIKIDIHRKSRALDAEIADAQGNVTADGVHSLLTDYHRNSASETYGGDLSATISRIDLESALVSQTLTPRQRQVVALYYIAELTGAQVAEVIGISRQAVEKARKGACRALAGEMNGVGRVVTQKSAFEETYETEVALWLATVNDNSDGWLRVPDAVWRELNERFPMDDARFTEASGCELSEGAEYSYLDRWEMHYRAVQREKTFDNIWPDARFAGRRVSGDDGNKYPIVRVL